MIAFFVSYFQKKDYLRFIIPFQWSLLPHHAHDERSPGARTFRRRLASPRVIATGIACRRGILGGASSHYFDFSFP